MIGGRKMPEIEYFNFKQAMNYAGIQSYTGLKELIKAGLPVVKVGRTKKISKTAIDKFMKDHEVITTSQKNI